MSFKRDGDDFSVTNSLQRRRVAELISEDIPPHEAHLMKNGLLACLVCHHRPVFDTLLVLQQHRQGKKHAHYHEQNLLKEQELFELREKRQHEECVKTGKTRTFHGSGGKNLGEARSRGILPTSSKYDPRVKKHKRHQRKPILDLSEDSAPTSHLSELALHLSEPNSHLSEPNSHLSEPNSHLSEPNSHLSEPAPHQCTPSDHNTSHHNSTNFNRSQQHFCNVQSTQEAGYVHAQCLDKQPQTISEYRKLQHHSKKPIQIRPYTGHRDRGAVFVSGHGQCEAADTAVTVQCSGQRPGYPQDATQCENENHAAAGKRERCQTKKKLSSELSEARREAVERHLQATSSGWKKDFRSGLWVKDEEAEFDSDEEPPQLP